MEQEYHKIAKNKALAEKWLALVVLPYVVLRKCKRRMDALINFKKNYLIIVTKMKINLRTFLKKLKLKKPTVMERNKEAIRHVLTFATNLNAHEQQAA